MDRLVAAVLTSHDRWPEIFMFDPITFAIDKVEDLIGHSPHPAVVAVPIGAYTVSNLCDGLATVTGDSSFDDAARISMAIGLIGAAAAAVTGMRDYSRIPREREGHEIATSHALGNAVATSMMAASFVLRVRDHAHKREAGVASRALALGAGALTFYTAWLGGKLVEELGTGVQRKVTTEEW